FYPAYGQNLQKKYKFRAIVKEDPFQEEFAYITSDWGYLDKGTWETRNCEYKR
ncbi:MAG: hypothetical protein GTN76_05075, partial [Candidatus Aenigmarchaeota archaeon]|nr:hypothetical protein [Candidatus Aenigmarchaeota archaeon]